MPTVDGLSEPPGQAPALVHSDNDAGRALCQKINVCLEKAANAEKKVEQFYTSAAIHIRTLQEQFPKTWQLVLKEHCSFGRSRAYEILAIADGRKTVEDTRAETAARVKRHTDQQGKNPLANGRSRTASPLQWGTADCEDESGLQWHEAKLPRNHRYTVIRCAADRRYDVMFDRTYLSFHAPTAEVGKAIAEAHYAARGLESAPDAEATAAQRKTENAAMFESEELPPEDNFETVERPEQIKVNILDTIDQSCAVVRAYKKILKVSSLEQETKDEISTAIGRLIIKWRSLQAALAPDDAAASAAAMKAKPAAPRTAEEARTEVIQRASSGEVLGHADVKAIVNQHAAATGEASVAGADHPIPDDLSIPRFLNRTPTESTRG